ncbi:Heparan-alpha-glucosaminide N-acetyltransferase [Eumeta japonica]|uniref:Heparan-alpha-glucosaminide N-acetyltransferase n=1 Tax=Eumeta variegata TaxID=151549 RepID=A0A4C1UXV4_EUMVA|nr:Heparan-alpha-glucosaminide N-acetyltransferase [Eumeta japonica]
MLIHPNKAPIHQPGKNGYRQGENMQRVKFLSAFSVRVVNSTDEFLIDRERLRSSHAASNVMNLFFLKDEANNKCGFSSQGLSAQQRHGGRGCLHRPRGAIGEKSLIRAAHLFPKSRLFISNLIFSPIYNSFNNDFRIELANDVEEAYRVALCKPAIFVHAGGHQFAALHLSAWNGLAFVDVIFPCFAFVMGEALALTLNARLRSGTKKTIVLAQDMGASVMESKKDRDWDHGWVSGESNIDLTLLTRNLRVANWRVHNEISGSDQHTDQHSAVRCAANPEEYVRFLYHGVD